MNKFLTNFEFGMEVRLIIWAQTSFYGNNSAYPSIGKAYDLDLETIILLIEDIFNSLNIRFLFMKKARTRLQSYPLNHRFRPTSSLEVRKILLKELITCILINLNRHLLLSNCKRPSNAQWGLISGIVLKNLR